MTLSEAIRAIYAQVDAPGWAAANLDALADVLRDLSWLPDGLVEVRVPPGEADSRLAEVLDDLVRETSGGRHPLRVRP